MSWRRYRVLLQFLFDTGALSRPGDDVADTPQQQAQRGAATSRMVDQINWDNLTGKDTSGVEKKTIDFNDFMKSTGITKRVV